ncbi:mannosyltransferase [Microterricola gilva]|uniref:Mannosyltransferase n=1 Tax=Microterricola gilva TaxID=393267 RepID=A0A4Q8ARF3_9MICO|nr:glycosyltransferase family 39 protein [Microterricola gilva]RZU66723.1 mannosyltransferase [Microterricola gilva]
MVTTTLFASGRGPGPDSPEASDGRAKRARLAAVGVGALAASISLIGIATPSFWGDEAASVLTGSRSLPSLLGVLGHIDAVHGVYYVFLHLWMQLFGTSEVAVRVPSAISVGLAAAGIVALGRQLFWTRTGVFAGALFAVLPIVTRMGIEARSYAMGMAAAVWITVALIALIRRNESRRRFWVLYAVGLAASVYLFLFLVLLVLVHLAAVIGHRAPHAVWRRWLRALLLAVLLMLPILVLGFFEREQIDFLAHRNYATAHSVLVGQWFGTPLFALLAWPLIALSIVLLLRRGSSDRAAGLVLTAWLIAPTALLLAANAWVTPVYNLRYLAFCAPAVALLMARGVEALLSRVRSVHIRSLIAVVITASLVAAITPGYLAQRSPFAKDGGSDLRQTAQLVASHATRGDAVVFDQQTKPSRSPRLAIDLYPKLFAGLDDIGLVAPFAQRDALWDQVIPVAELGDRLAFHPTVWVVELGAGHPDVNALQGRGYALQATFPVHRMVVYKLSKE